MKLSLKLKLKNFAKKISNRRSLRNHQSHQKRRWLIGLCMIMAILVSFNLLFSCPKPIAGLFPPQPGEPTKTLYIVRQAWHTGLAWSQQDLPQMGPEAWRDAPYIEIGWGDRRFYYDSDFSVNSVLQAIFIPTTSVMHVVGFAEPPKEFFHYTDVWELELSERGFKNLFKFVQQTYAGFDGGAGVTGRSPLAGKSLYGVGNYYEALPSYSFWQTCNGWTAQALLQAGVPICPKRTLLVRDVVAQLRRFFVPN
nr:DUF2459 domain-containing protein [Pseudanabaena sp. PCC 7367]